MVFNSEPNIASIIPKRSTYLEIPLVIASVPVCAERVLGFLLLGAVCGSPKHPRLSEELSLS